MRRLALAAFFISSLGSFACGGEDDGGAPITVRDGGTDASLPGSATCNPLTNAGCSDGEKCGSKFEGQNGEDVAIFRTTCVPVGAVEAGGACTRDDDGNDDCAAGGACFAGQCFTVCNSEGNEGCGQDDGCTQYSNVFTEASVDGYGVCEAACDPVTSKIYSNGEPSDESCPEASPRCIWDFRDPGDRRGTCVAEIETPELYTQDKTCLTAPGGNSCYLDGCSTGFTPLPYAENPFSGNPADANWCLGMCRPVDTFAGATPSQPAGDPSAPDCLRNDVVSGLNGPYSCRYVNYFGEDFLAPNEIGTCIPTGLSDLGDCEGWDFDAFVEALNEDGTNDDEFYCSVDGTETGERDSNKCPAGCISLETLNAAFPDPAMALRAKKIVGLTPEQLKTPDLSSQLSAEQLR